MSSYNDKRPNSLTEDSIMRNSNTQSVVEPDQESSPLPSMNMVDSRDNGVLQSDSSAQDQSSDSAKVIPPNTVAAERQIPSEELLNLPSPNMIKWSSDERLLPTDTSTEEYSASASGASADQTLAPSTAVDRLKKNWFGGETNEQVNSSHTATAKSDRVNTNLEPPTLHVDIPRTEEGGLFHKVMVTLLTPHSGRPSVEPKARSFFATKPLVPPTDVESIRLSALNTDNLAQQMDPEKTDVIHVQTPVVGEPSLSPLAHHSNLMQRASFLSKAISMRQKEHGLHRTSMPPQDSEDHPKGDAQGTKERPQGVKGPGDLSHQQLPKAFSDPNVRSQLANLKEHRPYFLIAVTLIQTFYMFYSFIANYNMTGQLVETYPPGVVVLLGPSLGVRSVHFFRSVLTCIIYSRSCLN